MTREARSDVEGNLWIGGLFIMHFREKRLHPYPEASSPLDITLLQGFVVRAEDLGRYQVLWTCPDAAPSELLPVVVFDGVDPEAVRGDYIKAFGRVRSHWTPDYRVPRTLARGFDVYRMQIYTT